MAAGKGFFASVCSLVYFQDLRSAKRLVTKGASIRFFPTMNLFCVFSESSFLKKALVTLAAFKGFLSSMPTFMFLKFSRLGKTLITLVTLKRLITLFMFCQMSS